MCTSNMQGDPQLAAHAEWEIIGPPELRRPQGGSFNPWK
jgi:hypothetical protein